jgi:crossover junction endodeoxyribonuclease RusA
MTDTKTPALAEATLVFDSYSRPPLTENQRMAWRQRHGIVRVVRRLASFKAREAGLSELGVCRVTLTWFVKTRTRRDADNIVPTLKAMCDGLVDAGVVVDDIPALMGKPMPRIVYEQGGTPRLELHVQQVRTGGNGRA